MTIDSRSDDPLRPLPGPDDATAAWAAPVGPSPRPDPFDQTAVPSVASAPVPAAPVRRRGGSGMFVNAILAVALVVAVGGVAFAVGRATAPAATATGRTGFGANGQGFPGGGGPNASGAPGAFNGGFGAGGISIQGTVTAVSADSITIQTAGGQSVTIPLNASTTYATRTPATAAAVTSGSTVIVQLQSGRGAFGNGNGGQGGGPNASGAPGRTLGPASNVTVVPAGS